MSLTYTLTIITLPFTILYHALYYACFIDETLALASAIRAGADSVAGMTREKYLSRLTWLRDLSRFHIASQKDDRSRSVFIRITNILENLKLDESDGKIRKQPYCVVLTGPPGCGKTSTAMKFAEKFIKLKHNKFYPTDVVTLNETDDYQSEFRTNHKVVIFDDIGAENVNMQPSNPWRKIIDFVNNVKKTALNPNVDLKGVVYIEPELVIITTNNSIHSRFGISAWMNCESALERRFTCILKLDPDFVHCQRTKTQLTGNSLDRRVYNLKHQPVLVEEDLVIDEVIELESLLFIKQQQNQHEFVEYINDTFDERPVSGNAFQAFFNDVLRPVWPTKWKITSKQEESLLWWEKLGRKFCVEGAMLYEAQSGTLSETTKNYLLENDKDGCQIYLETNFNVLQYLIYRGLPTFKQQNTENITVVRDGFILNDYLYMDTHLHKMYDQEPSGIKFSYEQLETYFHKIRSEESKNSDDEEDTNSVILDPLIECNGFLFREDPISISQPLRGFKERRFRKDRYSKELLETMPNRLQLVLQEWKSSRGTGDFVFYLKSESRIPIFIVVELKSCNFEECCTQANGYGQIFSEDLDRLYSGKKRVYGLAITPSAQKLFFIKGNNEFHDEQVSTIVQKWHSIFTSHCGVTRDSVKRIQRA